MVPSGKKDPWWNFDWLINLKKQMGIRSSFYFLQKEDSKMDSQYKFKNKKIKRLISYIKKAGFEAGLHGSFYSYNNPGKLQQQVAEWTRNMGTPSRRHPAAFPSVPPSRNRKTSGISRLPVRHNIGFC
ncbi:MAG: hypothetical protein ACOCTO_00590 [Marinilabiliaceae bacterium]